MIGAGIVGVCCALSLIRDGWRVTLVDRQAPGEGASFGNGSVLTPDSVVPVATPELYWRLPGMLLDPQGPLRIRWRSLPKLAPWLLRFAAASRKDRVEAISVALAELGRDSIESYGPLTAMAGAEDMICRSGWLCIYETKAEYRGDAASLELKRRRGVAMETLGPEEIRQMEPALKPGLVRGVFYPNSAYVMNNFRLVQVLAEAFSRHGGSILRSEVRDFDMGPSGPQAVVTDQGRLGCDAVVIAAGAWSKPLAAKLGSNPPLDTERGYHLHISEPGVMPRLPVYSTRRAFVCSPLEHGLRLAGTVELGGLDAPPDWRRAEVLLHHAKRWLPGLKQEGMTRWMGFRPSMPDSLPVISASPRFGNVFYAFGHGHLGLTLGARSGHLIADLLAGRTPDIDMAPYRVDRF